MESILHHNYRSILSESLMPNRWSIKALLKGYFQQQQIIPYDGKLVFITKYQSNKSYIKQLY